MEREKEITLARKKLLAQKIEESKKAKLEEAKKAAEEKVKDDFWEKVQKSKDLHDNLDDLTEQERVRIQSFNESYATVGADANLISQFAEDAAKVKEAEEAAAAKRARTERLRKIGRAHV